MRLIDWVGRLKFKIGDGKKKEQRQNCDIYYCNSMNVPLKDGIYKRCHSWFVDNIFLIDSPCKNK